MYKCKDKNCGLYFINDRRCCYYCEYKNDCKQCCIGVLYNDVKQCLLFKDTKQ